MSDYILSFILGIVEGLTEFLPVSSTAHLRITEALLGMDLGNGYWKMFSIVIQLGPILCLPIYFRNRITRFFQTFPQGAHGDKTIFTHPLSLTAIAFIATSATSLPLIKVIGKHLESLYVMGLSLLIGGIVMWLIDVQYGRPQEGVSEAMAAGELEKMSIAQAIWIGLCQTLAPVFPGTSRSMATISAGEVAGLSRSAALEFSFLLSIPTMAASTAYDLLKFLRPSAETGGPPAGRPDIDPHGWALLAIGFVVSFIVAYAVIAWFMNWVRTRGFTPFAIYRILAGAAVLVWALKAH
ncbi:MAG TPA: undecaprenyl-diphosphate phosphatase [Bryobacteraceae bacterium]|nr:undecaprenyl-diphosphate phosphatase [Bryobacteraceae bacterium]